MPTTIQPFLWPAPVPGDALRDGAVTTAAAIAAIAAGLYPQICTLRADVSTLLTHAQSKTIGLDGVDIDTNGMADLANDRIVCRRAGYYAIDAHIGYVFKDIPGYRRVIVMVNGVLVKAGRAVPANTLSSVGTNLATSVATRVPAWFLNVGDVVTMQGLYTENGGTGSSTTSTAPAPDIYAPRLTVAGPIGAAIGAPLPQ